jgi:hypothetical protein
MDLKETEARNYWAGEGQRGSNRSTEVNQSSGGSSLAVSAWLAVKNLNG